MPLGIVYSPHKVKKLLRLRGLFVWSLAEAADVPALSLSRWQAHRGHPNRAELSALAAALSVEPYALVETQWYETPNRQASRAKNWRVREDVDTWLGPAFGLTPPVVEPDTTPQAQRWALAVERRKATVAARKASPEG